MEYNYMHGANIYKYDKVEQINDYSSNTNPLEIPINKLKLDITSEELTRYPDPFYTKLRTAIANKEEVNIENVFVSNGAADIIFRIVLALKPKKALLLAPTFSEYEKALNVLDCNIDYYYLKAENKFKIQEDILDYLDNNYDLIILCNPNNPTSLVIEKNIIKDISTKINKLDTFLLVDECFIEFINNYQDNSFKSYLSKNIGILKAFTKIYNMAGYRLGYCLIENAPLINKLYLVGADWSVSSIAQEIALNVLQDKEYLLKTRELLNIERKYLLEELSKLNIKVIGSQANYIFFEYPNNNLKDKFLNHNILIRSCANYNGLDQTYYRICIKDHDNNLELITKLKTIINEE
ncbi:MAG: aminotransferase class I/II-fold pyridoxal phosphate-dependent enzyme [Erysipelotrichales bacterium]